MFITVSTVTLFHLYWCR